MNEHFVEFVLSFLHQQEDAVIAVKSQRNTISWWKKVRGIMKISFFREIHFWDCVWIVLVDQYFILDY